MTWLANGIRARWRNAHELSADGVVAGVAIFRSVFCRRRFCLSETPGRRPSSPLARMGNPRSIAHRLFPRLGTREGSSDSLAEHTLRRQPGLDAPTNRRVHRFVRLDSYSSTNGPLYALFNLVADPKCRSEVAKFYPISWVS